MDYMIRATAANAQVRAFAVTSKDIAEYARKAHDLSPVAAAALGRSMSAALMMADMLKGPSDLLTIQIDGDGPIGRILVTADNNGGVKGYVQNPKVYLPNNAYGHLNVGGAVGRGTLTVIRDMGMKDPYVGQTAIQTGEIAEDITYYYAVSEQIPSSVGLGVLVNTKENRVMEAGGFIVQLMPFAEEETIAALEKNLGGIEAVTKMLSAGDTPEMMLEKVLKGLDPVITDRMPVEFRCNCGKERYERALVLLGRDEMQKIVDDGEPVEIECQFCGKKYAFTPEELKEVLRKTEKNA
ncbi:MAG: Hsp33 family molecular chaperone HslO [Lachnospiraceae bacterium]|jgi:molecular chaperone Hsp33|nr:Hsp33 family molecular chaperone HslO [Lachnospiraceae bacterium]